MPRRRLIAGATTIAAAAAAAWYFLHYQHKRRGSGQGSHSDTDSRGDSSSVSKCIVDQASSGAMKNRFYPRSLVRGCRRCLILGDGNLSYSLSIVKQLRRNSLLTRLFSYMYSLLGSHATILPEYVLITTFDTVEQLYEKYGEVDMAPVLSELSQACNSSNGFFWSTKFSVVHGIDATKLTEYFGTTDEKFDLILWNFPHWGGRGYIQRNRRLLKNFFSSASKHLASGGEIHVALKEGQGGTPVDKELGSMGNTWRAVESAAAAGLVLASVKSFEPPEGYSCSGRRSTSRGFWIDGALNHVFVSAAEKHRPISVAPSGIFPPSYMFDISFWVLDEVLYSDSDFLAVAIGTDECVRSVDFQNSISAVPRDSRISQGASLRSLVYRITYQSETGPESRESMLLRHDNLRAHVASILFPAILVRGGQSFQKPYVDRLVMAPDRDKVIHLKGFGSGLSGANLAFSLPLLVAEIERIAFSGFIASNDVAVSVKLVWDGDPYEFDGYTALIPQLLDHFEEHSPRLRLSLCAYRCRNPDGSLDRKYEEGSPEVDFNSSWSNILADKWSDVEVRHLAPPDGVKSWEELDSRTSEWYTIWATLGVRSLGSTGSLHVIVVGGGECTKQEYLQAGQETEWVIINVKRNGRGPSIISPQTTSDIVRIPGGKPV